MGSNFCDFCGFSSNLQEKVPSNKNYCKHYSCKNLLQTKYSLTNLNLLHKKYSTKKSCVLNYNLSLSFRNNEILVYCLKICISQRAKKVVSDSPGLVDFAIGLVNSVLNLRDGQVMFFEKFKLKKNCEINYARQKAFGAS